MTEASSASERLAIVLDGDRHLRWVGALLLLFAIALGVGSLGVSRHSPSKIAWFNTPAGKAAATTLAALLVGGLGVGGLYLLAWGPSGIVIDRRRRLLAVFSEHRLARSRTEYPLALFDSVVVSAGQYMYSRSGGRTFKAFNIFLAGSGGPSMCLYARVPSLPHALDAAARAAAFLGLPIHDRSADPPRETFSPWGGPVPGQYSSR